MYKIKIRLADIPLEVQSESDFMTRFCRDYITDEPPLFSVSADKAKVEAEMNNTDEPVSFDYAEALCIYREIAERLPLFDKFVFHGAAIEFDGKAYLFTAPSGTGKSTHISLWRYFLGEKVNIINGDKPVIALKDGVFTVFGTPYAGKEGWQRNVSAPLAGICVLSQGKDNKITQIKDGHFMRLYTQTYKPHDKDSMKKTLSLVKSLCKVPCFMLSCDISRNAARASFEALTNQKFEVNENENQ